MAGDVRLTEERLRNYLDSNQAMQEQMCLALLPLLGSYAREQPRRPKGGPDGGRDIEAVFQGTILVWGAVGFKNGGGRDEESRKWAEQKFNDDLDRALQENPSLPGFVFFTNVDLTPTRRENLYSYGRAKGMREVAIFDFERIRHVLDSPEGLIVRLQYLDIEMSKEEQLGLIHKFGEKLHSVMASRFDRVENTLVRMERFLDFQKPIYRVDIYLELVGAMRSNALGDEAVLLRLGGLHDIDKQFWFLCVNDPDHPFAVNCLTMQTHCWGSDNPKKILTMGSSLGAAPNLFTSYNELSLTTGGNRVAIAHLTSVNLTAYCTDGIRGSIRRLSVDVNGYEMFSCEANGCGLAESLSWPEKIPYDAKAHQWSNLLKPNARNLLFAPLQPTRRFSPLQRLSAQKIDTSG
ncbi:MAG: hypothetical protein JW719_08335 [Pirellulales bacterium]|nr:hypothetical protein [Pirellulales bacterium]